MSIFLALQSFKIYKTNKERVVQVLFVVFFAILAAITIFNPGDSDMSGMLKFMSDNEYRMKVLSTPNPLSQIFSVGNLVYFIFSFIVRCLGIVIAWIYLAIYLKSVRTKMSEQYPQLDISDITVPADSKTYGIIGLIGFSMVYGLILIAVMLLSSPFFFIPFVIFSVFSYYVIPVMIDRKVGINTAFRSSFSRTPNQFFVILMSNVFLAIIMDLIEMLLLGIISSNNVWSMLISTFIFVYISMARGRLMGMTYLIFMNHPIPKYGSFESQKDAEKYIQEFIDREEKNNK